MNTPTAATASDWPRPYWTPGQDEQAVLLFFVFGHFDDQLRIATGAGGLQGMDVQRQTHAALAQWDGYPLAGALGEVLAEDHARSFTAAREAPDVLTVRGRLDDPSSLNYLRDTIDTLSRLFDVGAKAIIDPQILSLFDAERWRDRFQTEGGAPPRAHVLILANEDDNQEGTWVRTRGMRKFARPDISIHGVPQGDVERAGALCERLVEMQAMGGHFDDGQELDIEGLPGTLTLHPDGSMDDPRFNNTHVAMQWPR